MSSRSEVSLVEEQAEEQRRLRAAQPLKAWTAAVNPAAGLAGVLCRAPGRLLAWFLVRIDKGHPAERALVRDRRLVRAVEARQKK